MSTVRWVLIPLSTGRWIAVHRRVLKGSLAPMTLIRIARRCLSATLEMALPTTCGGCGAPGARWCGACAEEVGQASYSGGARQVCPSPCPRGYPPTWAASPYDGAARKALVQFKDGDRRDLLAVLAPLLAQAVTAVLLEDPTAAGSPGVGQRARLRRAGSLLAGRRSPTWGLAAGAVDPCCCS